MLERLKIILTHPTRIGLFFRDKIYIPILFLLTMLFLLVGVDLTYNINTNQFNYENAKAFNYLVQYTLNDQKQKPVLNIAYDGTAKKITGDNHVFIGDKMILAVNSNNIYQRNEYISINLTADGATLFEGFIKLGYVEYKSIDAKSFNLTNVQNGEITDCLYFAEFVDKLFDKVQVNQALLHSLDNAITTAIFYFGVLIFAIFASYFINPPIEMRVRIRLVLYDTFSYLFVMLLVVLTRSSWLQYVALVFPIFYVNMTFSHIKKIR